MPLLPSNASCNSFASVQPKMEAEFVNVYVDDVIVFSSSLENHLKHLRKVGGKLMEAGLTPKPSKCHLARAELEYLGLVTPIGLKPIT